jgi:hypothetical protein
MLKINNDKFKLKFICYSLVFLLAISFSLPAWAITVSDFDEFLEDLTDEFSDQEGGTQVINKVEAVATTGGNEVNGDEVGEGTAKAEAKVKTIINGQVVEDINISKESADGEASVKIESYVEADSEKAIVETTTVINNEETTEKQEIDLAGEEGVPILFSENAQATSVSFVESNENKEEITDDTEENQAENQSVLAENIIAKIFINIFSAFKAGILKIFGLFT